MGLRINSRYEPVRDDRANLNLVAGDGVSLALTDDAASDQTTLTISSTPSGSSETAYVDTWAELKTAVEAGMPEVVVTTSSMSWGGTTCVFPNTGRGVLLRGFGARNCVINVALGQDLGANNWVFDTANSTTGREHRISNLWIQGPNNNPGVGNTSLMMEGIRLGAGSDLIDVNCIGGFYAAIRPWGDHQNIIRGRYGTGNFSMFHWVTGMNSQGNMYVNQTVWSGVMDSMHLIDSGASANNNTYEEVTGGWGPRWIHFLDGAGTSGFQGNTIRGGGSESLGNGWITDDDASNVNLFKYNRIEMNGMSWSATYKIAAQNDDYIVDVGQFHSNEIEFRAEALVPSFSAGTVGFLNVRGSGAGNKFNRGTDWINQANGEGKPLLSGNWQIGVSASVFVDTNDFVAVTHNVTLPYSKYDLIEINSGGNAAKTGGGSTSILGTATETRAGSGGSLTPVQVRGATRFTVDEQVFNQDTVRVSDGTAGRIERAIGGGWDTGFAVAIGGGQATPGNQTHALPATSMMGISKGLAVLTGQTADLTLALVHNVVVMNPSANPRTVTLPTAAEAYKGKTYTIKNIHATNVVNIVVAGGANIDGATPVPLTQYQVAMITCDGAAWYLLHTGAP